MNFGLDIHGVAKTNPQLFSEFTKLAIWEGHQIHVITGMMASLAKNELQEYAIARTHFFSITDHHVEIESGVTFDKNLKPWLREKLEIWDRTKADYARLFNLDIHIDDSMIYGKYFPRRVEYVRYEHALGFHARGKLLMPTTIEPQDLLKTLITFRSECQGS